MRWGIGLLLLLWPLSGWAENGSLMGAGLAGQGRLALFAPNDPPEVSKSGSSLFVGQAKGSYFAPFPVRVRVLKQIAPLISGSAVQRLRHIIGQAESPRAGYDAVQHGARIKPRKAPTQMTIGEIYDWIAATPGQPHAIGKYQFIPPTLQRVVAKVGAKRSDRFTPAMQDRLADVLLEDAGFSRFMAGQIHRRVFINNLAAIWAGLPTTDGRSKYHGYAGNRATSTLAYFQEQIAKIGPS